MKVAVLALFLVFVAGKKSINSNHIFNNTQVHDLIFNQNGSCITDHAISYTSVRQSDAAIKCVQGDGNDQTATACALENVDAKKCFQ